MFEEFSLSSQTDLYHVTLPAYTSFTSACILLLYQTSLLLLQIIYVTWLKVKLHINTVASFELCLWRECVFCLLQVIRKGEVSCCWTCTPCKENEFVFDEYTCQACELGSWPNNDLTGRYHKRYKEYSHDGFFFLNTACQCVLHISIAQEILHKLP